MPDGTKLSDRLITLRETMDAINITTGAAHALGDVFVWAGYTWRTVHNTDECEYAALYHTSGSATIFSFDNVYAGSTVASKCDDFLATISQEDQTKLMDITVNGVTSKVFIPSYDQVTGGFAWFAEAAHRCVRASLYNFDRKVWWTSTPIDDGRVWVVDGSDGSVYGGSVTNSNYVIRPCIAVKR